MLHDSYKVLNLSGRFLRITHPARKIHSSFMSESKSLESLSQVAVSSLEIFPRLPRFHSFGLSNDKFRVSDQAAYAEYYQKLSEAWHEVA